MRKATKKPDRGAMRLLAAATALQLLLGQAPLLALPQGGQVGSGDVSFELDGDTMTVIQNSHKAIVNYESFNLSQSETVRFIQPGETAAILNRIGGDQSVIEGMLLANGQIYLVNPNGILFTSSARVNAAALIASGFDITDANFLSGRLLFTGGEGSVVNRGAITAGRIFLIGRTVENFGVLTASDVILASARKSVEIDRAGDGVIRLILDGEEAGGDSDMPSDPLSPLPDPGDAPETAPQADTPSAPLAPDPKPVAPEPAAETETPPPAVEPQDPAPGPQVADAPAEATTPAETPAEETPAPSAEPAVEPPPQQEAPLVNIEPVMPAAPPEDPGAIAIAAARKTDAGLVMNQGTINATADTGGSVAMRGIMVGQLGSVRADGLRGDGGSITMEADDTVALGENSLTTANAGLEGDGGSIVVFSPDTALMRPGAKMEARGGQESGDGGFIEVSGRQHVEIQGITDASSQNGKNGQFLIDPSNVKICNPVLPETDTGTWTGNTFDPSQDDAVVDIANLVASLKNNDVLITTANPLGTQVGNITVVDDIDLDGTDGNTLELRADGIITVNGNLGDSIGITQDKTGLILDTLGAGNIVVNGIIDTGGGDLAIIAGDDVAINNIITTDGGSFSSRGHDFSSAAGATISTSGGIVNLYNHSGDVSINDTVDSGSGYMMIGGDSVTFNPNGGDVIRAGSLSVTVFSGDVAVNGGISVNNGASFSHVPATGVGLGAAPGVMTLSGDELGRISAAALTVNSGGNIAVDGVSEAASDKAGEVLLDSANAVSFQNGGSTFNSLTVLANNGIQVNANVSADSGDIALDGDANNIAEGGDSIIFADNVTLDADGGGITLDATYGNITANGILNLTADNGVRINDDLSGPPAPAANIITINADANADGNGLFYLARGARFQGNASQVDIIADDVDIRASLQGGTVSINDSDGDGIGIGLASVSGGLNMSGSELQHVSSGALWINTGGSIYLDDVRAQNSDAAGTVILDAGDSIVFQNNESVFDALTARADNGIYVGADVTTDTGLLALEADANNALDGDDDIRFANGVSLDSAGGMMLNATAGDISGAGALSLAARDGIMVNDSLVTAGALVVNADSDADGNGDLAVPLGSSMDSGVNALSIIANDVNLLGTLNGGVIVFRDSDNAGMGLGNTAGGFTVDGAELWGITAASLTLDTSGSIAVDGIDGADSDGIGTVILDSAGAIAFQNDPSTFNALDARADNGIRVNANIYTATGDLALDGDADNAADGDDAIRFAAGRTLDSAGSLTLQAATGGMAGDGALSLEANNGVVLNGSLATAGALSVDADADNNGSGDFNLQAGLSVNSGANAMGIVANDIDLQGRLIAGAVTISDSDGAGIGLGNAAAGLAVSGTELRNITASSLELDSPGDIIADGVSATDSGSVGPVLLDAAGTIVFQGGASTFDSLTAQADNGIRVNADVSTDNGDIALDGDADNAADGADDIQFSDFVTLDSTGSLTLDATTGGMTANSALSLEADDGIWINDDFGSLPSPFANLVSINADADSTGGGSLNVAAGAALQGGAGQLHIIADDLNFQGSVSSGTMTIEDSDGSGIWIGGTPVAGDIGLSGDELQRVESDSLVVLTGGPVSVDGITDIQSDGVVSLHLLSGNGIDFQNNASTFNALDARADNGIRVDADISTDNGDMTLDGDADNAADGDDAVRFAAGRKLDSTGSITLRAATGGMAGDGALSLEANNGVVLNSSLATAGALSVDADADNNGSGDFNLQAGLSVNSGANAMGIVANDIDLQGRLIAGAVTISDSDGAGIGLGNAAAGLAVSGSELRNITAASVELDTAGDITADGVSATDSGGAGSVLLDAAGAVVFQGGASTFDSLAAQADNGIRVNADVATDSGDMTFDGDADNAADGDDAIRFAAGRKLDSGGSLSLRAATGGLAGDGALSLEANNGIALNNSLSTAGALSVDTDADNNGSGDFNTQAGVAVNAGANAMNIVANDVNLQGTLSAGALTLSDSDGAGIGLGNAAAGLTVSGTELRNITSASLELDTAGDITADGVSATDSDGAGTVLLDAAGAVVFQGGASTFDSLAAQADNGIRVNADVATDSGDMTLDGDADNAADGDDAIRFAAGRKLDSAGSLTLQAETGGLEGAGELTLDADNGIFVNDGLAAAGDLTFNGDVTAAAGIVLESDDDLAVADGFALRGAGALGVRAGGDLTLGGDAGAAGALEIAADSDGDLDGLALIRGDVSTDGASPAGTVTLSGEIQCDGAMTIGDSDLTISGADKDETGYGIEAPIRAGGIVIRMGGDITDLTDGTEDALLVADRVSLSSRTGDIGGGDDLDTDAGSLAATARGDIVIEEKNGLRIAGGARAGRDLKLTVHGDIAGDRLRAGGDMTVDGRGGIKLDELAAGGNMNVEGRGAMDFGTMTAGGNIAAKGGSLEFDSMAAAGADADVEGSIAAGRALIAGLADFTAGADITDNDSMITAADIVMHAGGHIGGSSLQLDVGSISEIRAGEFIHITQNRAGNTPVGLISAGGEFEIRAPRGGLRDANGAAVNLAAGDDSSLALHGTCGTKCDPLEVDIRRGNLEIAAIDPEPDEMPPTGVWVSLAGRIEPDNAADSQVEYVGAESRPGLILFNWTALAAPVVRTESIARTEAFAMETPRLVYRQGVFGSPYFMHLLMDSNERSVVGIVDYIVEKTARITADPEFPAAAKRRINLWVNSFCR